MYLSGGVNTNTGGHTMNDFTMTPYDNEHAVFHAEIEIIISWEDFPGLVEELEKVMDKYNKGIK